MRSGRLQRSAPLRRKGRMKPMSDKRAAGADDRRDVRMALFARDGGRCMLATFLAPCAGLWTPHHVRKSSHGGRYTLDNLLSLCSHHNEWVENHPHVAWGLGLVCREGESLDDACARRRRAGFDR